MTETLIQKEEILLRQLHDPATKERAFEEMVRIHQRNLYWHLRRMVNEHEDVDDILQNTFIKAWKYIDNFRGESQLGTWLYRIATNECLTFLNKQKKRNQTDIENIEDHIDHSSESALSPDGEEIQQKLEKAVSLLPEKQRLVFNLKYYDELKYEEIAEILGGSVGSLKASFHHAVKKIEKYLMGD